MRRVNGLTALGLGFLVLSMNQALAADGVAAASASRTPSASSGVAPVQRIGVVNLDKLLNEYERTKSSVARLKEMTQVKQAERDKIASEIKGMREELILLNEQARSERQEEIEKKMKDLAEFDRQVKDALLKERDETGSSILEEVETTVAAYAKEHGFELILSGQAVLYGIETIDVTHEVLLILNERFRKKNGQ